MQELDPTKDPDHERYARLDSLMRKLTWQRFEELVGALLRESGFYSVQRLTSGSQHGRDLIGVWDSRFHLGRQTRFRIQAKHKQSARSLDKSEVGDSITDFLAQNADPVLLIVTNGQLSNDLLEQIDRLLANGHAVHAVGGDRFFRLLAAYPNVARRYLGPDADTALSLHHHFEVARWIDTIATQVEPGSVKFSLSRFWTEPYTWFFHRPDKDIERLWTTLGGGFRFSCHNTSDQIVHVGRTVLRLLSHTPLPPFYVLNTTPKGGRALPKLEVPLSMKLGEFELIPRDQSHLDPHSCLSSLVEFKDVDLGIYRFQVISLSEGGPQPARSSEVFTLVSVPPHQPNSPPPECIHVIESWPRSLPIIEWLFGLSPDELQALRSKHGGVFPRLMVRGGALRVVLGGTAPDGTSPTDLPISSPIAERMVQSDHGYLIEQIRNNPGQSDEDYRRDTSRLWAQKAWVEEYLDPSEPRAVFGRANSLTQAADLTAALEKAHERAPFFARFAVCNACECYSLGYLGFARYYLNAAYAAAPANPVVAAVRYLYDRSKPNPRPVSEFESALNPEHVDHFRIVVAYWSEQNRFPGSYGEAAGAPFGDNREKQDAWTLPCF